MRGKSIYKIIVSFIIILILFEFVFQFHISNAVTVDPNLATSVTNLAGGLVSILYWPRRIMLTVCAYAIDGALLQIAKTDDNTLNGATGIKYLTPFQIFFNKYQLLDANVLDLSSVNPQNAVTYPIRRNVSIWFHIVRLISAIILLGVLVYIGINMAISTIASDKAKYKKMLIDWSISLFLIFFLNYICIFILNINNVLVKAIETMSSDLVGLDKISDIYDRIALLATLGIGIQSITATIVYCAMVFMTIAFFIAYINRMIKVAFLVVISPLISITYSIDKMKDQKAQAFETWMKEFSYTVLIQPFHCIIYLAFTNTAYRLLEPFMAEGNGYLSNISELATTFSDTVMLGKDYNLLATSVLVIISLLFIKTSEDMIRKIFGFSDSNKSTSFGAGIAMSVMAVRQAKNIGTATRKSINSVKNGATNFIFKAIPNDANLVSDTANRISNTKLGRFVARNAEKLGDAVGNSAPAKAFNNVASKVANSRAVNSLEKFGNKTGKTIKTVGGATGRTINGVRKGLKGAAFKVSNFGPLGWKQIKSLRDFPPIKSGIGFMAKHNSIASVVGSMYGISQVVGGNNVLEAYADASAVEEGINAFRGNGEGKLASRGADAAYELDVEEYEKKVETYKKQGKDLDKDPFEEALDDLKQKIPSITSEADLRNRIQNDKISYNQSYSERASDLRNRSQQLRDEGNKELQSGETTNSKLDEANRLENEAKELEELARAEAIMNEKDELSDFWNTDLITERMLNRSVSPSSSDFKKARKELKEEILKILQQRKIDNEGSGIVGKGESDTADAIETSLEDIIEKSVLAEKNVDMERIINNLLNISKQSDSADYAKITEKTQNVRRLYLEQRVAESFDYFSKVNDDYGEFSERRLSKAFASRIEYRRLGGKKINK